MKWADQVWMEILILLVQWVLCAYGKTSKILLTATFGYIESYSPFLWLNPIKNYISVIPIPLHMQIQPENDVVSILELLKEGVLFYEDFLVISTDDLDV